MGMRSALRNGRPYQCPVTMYLMDDSLSFVARAITVLSSSTGRSHHPFPLFDSRTDGGGGASSLWFLAPEPWSLQIPTYSYAVTVHPIRRPFTPRERALGDRSNFVNYYERLAFVRSYFEDLPLPLPTARLAAGRCIFCLREARLALFQSIDDPFMQNNRSHYVEFIINIHSIISFDSSM